MSESWYKGSMLKRSDENESNNESEATTSFLSQLSNFESISSLANLDTEEMSEQLQQRVDSSTRAIEKIVQAFDRIVQRNARNFCCTQWHKHSW